MIKVLIELEVGEQPTDKEVAEKLHELVDSAEPINWRIEQSLENYLYWKNKSEEDTYCLNCGSRLGGDCGDAEPDFNAQFCSKGCYEDMEKK